MTDPWQELALQLMHTGVAVKEQKLTGNIWLKIECNQGGMARKIWTTESQDPIITKIKFDK